MRRTGVSFTLAIVVATASTLWADDPSVTVNPYPADPTISPYPDGQKPADLEDGEDGDAQFKVAPSYTFTSTASPNGITLTGINVQIMADPTNIRIPASSNINGDPLLEHEKGHHTLIQTEYTKSAAKKAAAGVKALSGKSYQGAGATPQQRVDDATAQAKKDLDGAMDRIGDSLVKQSEKINDKYDKITDHGGKKTINASDAAKQAQAEFAQAQPAGQIPRQVNPGRSAIEIQSNSRLAYAAVDDRFDFAGLNAVTDASSPNDPIIGKHVSIDRLIPIGLLDNGAYLLADTELQITNDDSTQLMDAFVVDLAYMPSNRLGFAGMLQGYLDIPPTGANGTNNVIGSGALADLQSAADGGEYLNFWYYLTEPLVNPNGAIALDANGAAGVMVLGVAVPEPMSMPLLLVGTLSAINARTRMRRQQRG